MFAHVASHPGSREFLLHLLLLRSAQCRLPYDSPGVVSSGSHSYTQAGSQVALLLEKHSVQYMTSSLTSSEPHRLHHHKSQDCFESNTTGQCSLAGISADIKLPMGKATRYYECTQQICYRPSASVPTEHPSPHIRFKSHSLTFGDSVRRVVFSQMALEPIVMLTEARNT